MHMYQANVIVVLSENTFFHNLILPFLYHFHTFISFSSLFIETADYIIPLPFSVRSSKSILAIVKNTHGVK